MQLEPSTGMDLTESTADGDPSGHANPVIYTSSGSPASTESCDSCGTGPTRTVRNRGRLSWGRETSNLTMRLGLWPPRVDVALSVEGPLSWAAPLCAVLGLAVVTYTFVPDGVLALVTGASVLLVGTGALLHLVRRGKQRDDKVTADAAETGDDRV